MKKILSIVMTLVFVLGFSITAFAYSNTEGFTVTLNHIGDDQDTLYYTSFPQTISLEGIVTYPTEYDNNGDAIHIDNQSITLNAYVGTVEPTFNDNGRLTNLDQFSVLSTDKLTRNSVDTSSFKFVFPWTIKEANTYYIVMTAKKANAYADDYQLVNVVTQITATQPAAPAVAADILKSAGVKPKYSGGNYISDVAGFMGPGTSFEDVATGNLVEKSDVENYRIAVYNYLVKLKAIK